MSAQFLKIGPMEVRPAQISELAGHPAQGRRYCRPGDLDRRSGGAADCR